MIDGGGAALMSHQGKCTSIYENAPFGSASSFVRSLSFITFFFGAKRSQGCLPFPGA
jgi:hypothetical protein